MTKKNKAKKNFLQWLAGSAIFIIILGILVVAAIGAYLIFEKNYSDKIYPGVYLGYLDLGGLTRSEAEDLIGDWIKNLNTDGILIEYNSRSGKIREQTTLFPIISSFSGDIAREIIKFDVTKTLDKAFLFGRKNGALPDDFSHSEILKLKYNLEDKFRAKTKGYFLKFNVSLNEPELLKILKQEFSHIEIPAKNAELIKEKENGSTIFAVSKEKIGKVMGYNNLIFKLKTNLTNLKTTPIEIRTITDYPEIYQEDGLKIANQANKILDFAPFTLISTSSQALEIKEKRWKISRDQLSDWLEFRKNKLSKTIIGLNGKAKEFLEKRVLPQVDIEPIDAKFEIVDGKMKEFQTGRDGLKVDLEATLEKIERTVLGAKNAQCPEIFKDCVVDKEIYLIIDKVSGAQARNLDEMGIKEVIGFGVSDFSGSPANRRHNIKVGIDSINGILIKPDEEFSLIAALGNIDEGSDYLPELVIKGDKTTPEYGGGLCQVGTTLFRTVINTGLPVTMRQNHSYRVAYYEPAGTDATIYDPLPDFRFINDTKKYILLQTKIKGENELYFEFWGTRDGRIASSSQPVIFNITEPPPTKIIKTTQLPEGEKKCTEKAHSGAQAYFDYQVFYPDGEVKEKRFNSRYIPWQEVCLVGTATSAESMNNE